MVVRNMAFVRGYSLVVVRDMAFVRGYCVKSRASASSLCPVESLRHHHCVLSRASGIITVSCQELQASLLCPVESLRHQHCVYSRASGIPLFPVESLRHHQSVSSRKSQASSLCPVESIGGRGAVWLYLCQELMQSPVEQPVSCDDVQSYCIWALVRCGDVGAIPSCCYWVASELSYSTVAALSRSGFDKRAVSWGDNQLFVQLWRCRELLQSIIRSVFRCLQLLQSILGCCDVVDLSI